MENFQPAIRVISGQAQRLVSLKFGLGRSPSYHKAPTLPWAVPPPAFASAHQRALHARAATRREKEVSESVMGFRPGTEGCLLPQEEQSNKWCLACSLPGLRWRSVGPRAISLSPDCSGRASCFLLSGKWRNPERKSVFCQQKYFSVSNFRRSKSIFLRWSSNRNITIKNKKNGFRAITFQIYSLQMFTAPPSFHDETLASPSRGPVASQRSPLAAEAFVLLCSWGMIANENLLPFFRYRMCFHSRPWRNAVASNALCGSR